jgi:hypothetical protein
MKADDLTTCSRCGGDACYKQEVTNEITTYSCFGCGFQSNSLMKKNGDFLNEQIEVLPELYKELMFEDENDQGFHQLLIYLLEEWFLLMDQIKKIGSGPQLKQLK